VAGTFLFFSPPLYKELFVFSFGSSSSTYEGDLLSNSILELTDVLDDDDAEEEATDDLDELEVDDDDETVEDPPLEPVDDALDDRDAECDSLRDSDDRELLLELSLHLFVEREFDLVL
jgi:hypothetical protein